jgi:hypothetical protein
MNANEAELVTVVSHSEDGRILQYIKNLIPVTEADRMKAAARLRAEEKKASALVKDTDALVEKAHAPATSEQKPAAAARPVRALPRPSVPPTPPIARPVTLTAHAEAKRKQAKIAAARKEFYADMAQLKADLAQARADIAEGKALISKKTIEVATDAGKECGRRVMKKALDGIPADTPPEATLSVNGKALQAAAEQMYKHLCAANYYWTVKSAEFAQTFAEAFMLGVREAAAEFESTPRQYPPRQADDAGETQAAS